MQPIGQRLQVHVDRTGLDSTGPDVHGSLTAFDFHCRGGSYLGSGGLLHTYISLPDLESSQLDKVFKSYLPPVEHCNLAHAQSDLRSIFCDALSEHV